MYIDIDIYVYMYIDLCIDIHIHMYVCRQCLPFNRCHASCKHAVLLPPQNASRRLAEKGSDSHQALEWHTCFAFWV